MCPVATNGPCAWRSWPSGSCCPPAGARRSARGRGLPGSPWSSRRSGPAASRVEGVEAGRGPGVGVGLDDERAQRVADRIGVGGEHAVWAVLVDEGEPVEHVGGAEPDELRARHLRRRSEVVGEQGAEAAVGAVAHDDQVEVVQFGEVADLVLETHLHALGPGPVLQQAQQRLADHGRHAHAADALPCAVHADLDVVPVSAVLLQRLAEDGVGGVDGVEGGVGEDHSEAERVVGAVAFEDHDFGVGSAPLQQRGEEESSGTCADAGNFHGFSFALTATRAVSAGFPRRSGTGGRGRGARSHRRPGWEGHH